MCGIVGAWGEGGSLTAAVSRARQQLRHRGPDDSGLWSDPAAGITLGHTRLAILDLSAAGHQPMSSHCGRWQLVFNGEIYNHLELRAALPGVSWRGHSDTETLLEAFASWGIERTLRASAGMFALALYDTRERRLYLARDRFGEKPLYYGYAGRTFVFASQLRALRTLPPFAARVDATALGLYLQLSYVPAPRSIYHGTMKLPAASWIELHAQALARGELPAPQCYWSAALAALEGERHPFDGDEDCAIRELESVLARAVRQQMIADVPLGAFLSGGVDSSTVVALMQAQSTARVRTFSIGFSVPDFDESRHAREVAQHLGTEHTELTARPEELLAIVERLPEIYDEPFADSSQLPTCLVAMLARPHVKVALSGDGGDELFGGYNRHRAAARGWAALACVPRPLRHGVACTLQAVSARHWERLAGAYRRVTPGSMRVRMLDEKIQRIAEVIGSEDERKLYASLIGRSWPDWPLEGAVPPDLALRDELPRLGSLAHRMMLADASGYLSDDILVKVDRASMAVGLEARVPMLDHRVYEFAWRLPLKLKIRGSRGKWLLRRLLCRHLPRSLVERPKMGFAVPLGAWLRGPLREWSEALLEPVRLREAGLQPEPIRALWHEHLAGRRQRQHHLWNVLMFQAWHVHSAPVPEPASNASATPLLGA